MKDFANLFLCSAVIILGNVVFFLGFFPIKKQTKHISQESESIFELNSKCIEAKASNKSLDKECFVVPLYDRLVFVVIDAMRKDFILGDRQSKHLTNLDKTMTAFKKENLNYINKLIKSKEALTFHSHVRPPTVTLSGIKTLTTGTVSAFVDVVWNFGSSALSDDNILLKLKDLGRRMIFYGDETWLKLFPSMFRESEGTTSFFVNDYTEVDFNVTRNLEKIMKRNDWDCLFLHYLGLDHIGHLTGPSNIIMASKLREMDAMIQYLKSSIGRKDESEGRRTLLVLTSDHGMTDDGSHGGSSDDELSTPLILVGSTFKHWKPSRWDEVNVNQVDIVPTLSLLLGCPIPSNSIGVVIPQVFMSAGTIEMLKAIHINGRQLLRILDRNAGSIKQNKFLKKFNEASEKHLKLLHMNASSIYAIEARSILSHYKEALDGLSSEFVSTMSKYDDWMLWIALFFTALCSVSLVVRLIGGSSLGSVGRAGNIDLKFASAVALICGGLFLVVHPEDFSMWKFISVEMMIILSVFVFIYKFAVALYDMENMINQIMASLRNPMACLVIAGEAIHCLSLLSSSYIEEEQNTHHFLVSTFLILVIILSCSKDVSSLTLQMTHSLPHKHNLLKFLCPEWTKWHDMNSSDPASHNFICGNKNVSHMFGALKTILSAFTVLLLCRVAKSWNQTGDKWKHLEDVGDWLNSSENAACLFVVVVVSMAMLLLMELIKCKSWRKVFVIFGLISSLIHQLSNGPFNPFLFWDMTSIQSIRIFSAQMSLGASVVLVILSCSRGLHASRKAKYTRDDEGVIYDVMSDLRLSFIIISLTLCRPHNSFLVLINYASSSFLHLLFHGQSSPLPSSLSIMLVSPGPMAVFYLWMGQASFYYQGNSNSLTTIDFAVGNKGQRSFSFVIACTLTLVNTYSSIIFWLLSFAIELLSKWKTKVELKARKKHSSSSSSDASDLCRGADGGAADDDLCHLFETPLRAAAATGDDDHDGDDNHFRDSNESRGGIREACVALLSAQGVTSTFYLLVMIMMRYHLFVWSVFAPKFLYVLVLQFLVVGFTIFFTSFCEGPYGNCFHVRTIPVC